MKRLLTSLPIWIVLCDMIYGVGLNLSQSLNLNSTANASPDGLPISPTIAFNSLQVVANGGMVLIIGFGLVVLLQLNRFVAQKWVLPIGIFRSLGLLAVLAFSIPSIWEWAWALITLAGGRNVINFSDARYLITALCLPMVAAICLYRIFGWYRLSVQQEKAGKNSKTKEPEERFKTIHPPQKNN